MLRRATPDDGPALVDLVVAAELFTRDEAEFLPAALTAEDGSTVLVEDADDGPGLAAVVLYRPEEATDRVHDLTLIAVRPGLHGSGRGTALVRHAEADLRNRGQRMLVVRTSALPRYDRTRAFYRGLGYTEHTHVPDYWADGDDLVLLTRTL